MDQPASFLILIHTDLYSLFLAGLSLKLKAHSHQQHQVNRLPWMMAYYQSSYRPSPCRASRRSLHWASREIKYRGWSVVTVSQSWTYSEREGTFRCRLNLPYHFFRWGQHERICQRPRSWVCVCHLNWKVQAWALYK